MLVRNVTGASTIPAGTAQFQTVTSVSTDSTILVSSTSTAWVSGGAVTIGQISVYEGRPYKNITGTNTTTAPSSDKTNWVFHVPDQRKFIWIYLPDDGAGDQAVGKILSVNPVIDTEASTYRELYYMDRAMATTGAVAFQFVVGNLPKFALDNNGGAAGLLNGETFAEDEILNAEQQANGQYPIKYQDVVTVDGTGTNFYIVEN